MPTLETLQVPDSQYQDIWKAALVEYERHTKVALPSIQIANPNTLSDVLHMVEGQQKQFSEFRHKGQVGALVKDVVSVIESFAEVSGEGVSVVSFGIVCIINLLTC